MRRTIGRWKRWRTSYRGYWRLASERLPAATHATLARLRWCESTNRYYVVNAGGYAGAYQYSASTYARAQAWRGTPRRYWRSVLASSKDHQDAVTGSFFFSHRSEWACAA